MNNKGFAITGIIYTTFILFLIILLSILGNLKFRNKILDKSIDSYDDTYLGELETLDVNTTNAPYTGLYEYNYSDTSDKFYEYDIGYCYMYVYKGNSIIFDNDTMYFSTKDCNNVKNNPNSSFGFTGNYYKIGE